MLARNSTSKALPTTGTVPATPWIAILPSIRAVTCQGAPSARASPTSHSDKALAMMLPTMGMRPMMPSTPYRILVPGRMKARSNSLQPLQPLLTGKVIEWIGGGTAETEAAKRPIALLPKRFLRDFPPLLINHLPTRCCRAKCGAKGTVRTWGSAGVGGRCFA